MGIQVYKHYCGEYLAAISVFHKSSCGDTSNEAESCAMQSEKSCCEDEMHFVQLDTDLAFQAVQTLNIIQYTLDLPASTHELNVEASLELRKRP